MFWYWFFVAPALLLTDNAKGERFGVRASAGRRPAAPKHDSILDDQRADRRIGRRGAKITPSEGQSG